MYTVENEDSLNHVYYSFDFPCADVNGSLSQKIYELDKENEIAQRVCDYFGFGVNTDSRYCVISYYYDFSNGGVISVGLTVGKQSPRAVFSPEELIGISEDAIAPIFEQYLNASKFKFNSKANIEGEIRVTTRIVVTRG